MNTAVRVPLSDWARKWHWADCAEKKPIDLTIYPRDERMLKAFLAATRPAKAVDVEAVAKWLHDETGHPDSYPSHTWPETERDDGQREGGFVKIVPLHAQEYFRAIARRLAAILRDSNASSDKETAPTPRIPR